MAGDRNQRTKRAILQYLKVHGGAEARDLARHFDLTIMAISRHLANLQTEHLIEGRTERRPRGRPTTVYALTEEGDAEFPRDYGSLACGLLHSLQRLDGGQKVDQLFRKRREEMTARYRSRVEGKPLEARVRETAAILSECGFMAEVRPCQQGAFLLTEHNCAIRDVARCFPAACQEELNFLKALIGAPMTRVSHLANGDRNCSYLVTLKSEGDRTARSRSLGPRRGAKGARQGRASGLKGKRSKGADTV